jgi:hypothetical protein
VKYLASEQITVEHDKALGIECDTEFAGYRFPWNTYSAAVGVASTTSVCWSGIDTTFVTWMNAWIWSAMKRREVAGPIAGFGKLLASL